MEWDVESFTANRRWDSKWPPVGVATLVPVGTQIWASGQSPEIAILTASVKKLSSFDAHEKYVSSLVLVERYETRVLWSCSVKDKKLKVCRDTETIPNQGSRALIRQYLCRGSFSAVSKLIFATN